MRKIPGLKKLPSSKTGDIIDDLRPAGAWGRVRSKGSNEPIKKGGKIKEVKLDKASVLKNQKVSKKEPVSETRKRLHKYSKEIKDNRKKLDKELYGDDGISGGFKGRMTKAQRDKQVSEKMKIEKDKDKKKAHPYNTLYGNWLKK